MTLVHIGGIFVAAAEDGTYEKIGKLIAYCVAHNCMKIGFFSTCLFAQISGESQSYKITDIQDATLREQIQKVPMHKVNFAKAHSEKFITENIS